MDPGHLQKWARSVRPVFEDAGVRTEETHLEDRWEGGTVTADLLQRARTGDGSAFGQLVEPHRRELHVHCYRILGSVADAEDALQDTLVSAWQALPRYEERASIRTWLYRIATNRCLTMLRSASRRPVESLPQGVEPPVPTRLGEIAWLEPYPDVLLEEVSDNPEARYEAKEAISLAFVTALQLLPPRQRAVLVLRDVLSYSAREVAEMIDATEQAVNSALKRARATLAQEMPSSDAPAPAPGSRMEQELLSRLTEAFEKRDVAGLVELMTEDAWLRMPPVPLEYQGRELAGRFFEVVAFRAGRHYRLIPTRANGQPAFGVYVYDAHSDVGHAFGLLVLTLTGDRISVITRFDNSTLAAFGLPRTLTD
jgi:RNA polymerase sigma-70 factor (ECF subfamily)